MKLILQIIYEKIRRFLRVGQAKRESVSRAVVAEKRTICEVHREIYDELYDAYPDDPLLEKVDEAFKMAKKMSNKLRQNYYNYDNGWWEENKDIKETLKRRKERK